MIKERMRIITSNAEVTGMIGNHARKQQRIEEFLNTSELINKGEKLTRARILLEDHNQHFMCEIWEYVDKNRNSCWCQPVFPSITQLLLIYRGKYSRNAASLFTYQSTSDEVRIDLQAGDMHSQFSRGHFWKTGSSSDVLSFSSHRSSGSRFHPPFVSSLPRLIGVSAQRNRVDHLSDWRRREKGRKDENQSDRSRGKSDCFRSLSSTRKINIVSNTLLAWFCCASTYFMVFKFWNTVHDQSKYQENEE